jgi:hypothetical protein
MLRYRDQQVAPTGLKLNITSKWRHQLDSSDGRASPYYGKRIHHTRQRLQTPLPRTTPPTPVTDYTLTQHNWDMVDKRKFQHLHGTQHSVDHVDTYKVVVTYQTRSSVQQQNWTSYPACSSWERTANPTGDQSDYKTRRTTEEHFKNATRVPVVSSGWRQHHDPSRGQRHSECRTIKQKVKEVKFSLCLTKHHAMKAYWGSGDIAPRILWPRH